LRKIFPISKELYNVKDVYLPHTYRGVIFYCDEVSDLSIVSYLEKTELKKFHYTLLVIAFLVYMFTAMNVLLISGALPRIMDDLNIGKPEASYLISMGFWGMLIGAILFGRLADIIGRRIALILTISIHAVFTALFGTTHDYNLLSLYRFLAGIGLGGALPIPGVYISEYVPAKHRGKFVGLIETAWVWGTILSIGINLAFLSVWDWEGVFYWGLSAIVLVPLVFLFLPESIRYLEEKDRIEEALEVLRKYDLIVGEVEIKAVERKKISWRELFKPEYIARTVLLMSLWAILVYTYYGVFIWLPAILKERYNLLASLIWTIIIILPQIPGYYSAAFLLDKLGRKKILEIYLILAGVGSILVALSDFFEIGKVVIGNYEIGTILLIGFIIISFFNLGAWSGLYTYTPELYPTEYRGIGSGIAAASGRFAGIIAPIVTGFLLIGGSLLPAYSIFFLLHVIGGLLVLIMGIETKGLTL